MWNATYWLVIYVRRSQQQHKKLPFFFPLFLFSSIYFSSSWRIFRKKAQQTTIFTHISILMRKQRLVFFAVPWAIAIYRERNECTKDAAICEGILLYCCLIDANWIFKLRVKTGNMALKTQIHTHTSTGICMHPQQHILSNKLLGLLTIDNDRFNCMVFFSLRCLLLVFEKCKN